MRQALIAIAVLALLSLPLPGHAAVTLRVDITGASNIELALSYSALIEDGGAPTVLLGRDDVFADSLASGVLQTGVPLLLTPRDTLSPLLLDELDRLGTENIIIMGGEAAVSSDVADPLSAQYNVRRIEGASRVETALDAAAELPGATSAILVRANADGDPTRAFADALAAGAWASAAGYVVLLTNSESLHPATSAYLAGSAIETVHLIGGESALSAQVLADVEALGLTANRISGASRFATAVAIADARGMAGAPGSIILVEGQGDDAWARGFPAAILGDDAVVLLTSGSTVPEPTLEYLNRPAFQQDESLNLVCAAPAAACDEVIEALGGLAAPSYEVTLDATEAAPGDAVTATLTGDLDAITTVAITGCFGDHTDALIGENGTINLTVDVDAPAGDCDATFTITVDGQPDPVEISTTLTVIEAGYAITLDPTEAMAGETVTGTVTGDVANLTNLSAMGCLGTETDIPVDAEGTFTVVVPDPADAGECTATFSLTHGADDDTQTIDVTFTVIEPTGPTFETLTVIEETVVAEAISVFPGGSTETVDLTAFTTLTIDGNPSDANAVGAHASLGDELQIFEDGETLNMASRNAKLRVETIVDWNEDFDEVTFTFTDREGLDTSGMTVALPGFGGWQLDQNGTLVTITREEFQRSLAPGATFNYSRDAGRTYKFIRTGADQVYGLLTDFQQSASVVIVDYFTQEIASTIPDVTVDRYFHGSLAYGLFSASGAVEERPITEFKDASLPGHLLLVTPDPDGGGKVFTLRPLPMMGTHVGLDVEANHLQISDTDHPFFESLANGATLFNIVRYADDNEDPFDRGVTGWDYLDGSLAHFETRVQQRPYVLIVPTGSDNTLVTQDSL